MVKDWDSPNAFSTVCTSIILVIHCLRMGASDQDIKGKGTESFCILVLWYVRNQILNGLNPEPHCPFAHKQSFIKK